MEVFLIWKHVYDTFSDEEKLPIGMMPRLEKFVYVYTYISTHTQKEYLQLPEYVENATE